MALLKKIINKISRKLREAIFERLHGAFNTIPAAVKQQRGLRILVYHAVVEGDPHLLNARALSVQHFEEHLIAINQCFNAVSLEDVRTGNLSASRLNVLLTFDDGLKNNYIRALPLLQKHKVPAVFFISAVQNRNDYLFSDVLDAFSILGPDTVVINGVSFTKKKRWLHYRYMSVEGTTLAGYFHALNVAGREAVLKQVYTCVPKEKFKAFYEYIALMNEEELKDLSAQKNFTVGSHGMSHTDLSLLDKEELRSELQLSKQALQTITSAVCDTLAFPYGNYSQAVLSLSKEAGYTELFGTEKLNNAADRKIILERITVNPYVSAINQAYYIAKNNYA